MKSILTVLLIFSNLWLIAQSSGSLYSAFGLGELRSYHIGQQEVLGGTGIGLRSPVFMNSLNPAGNVFMQKPATVHLDIGVYLDANYARNEQAQDLQKGGGLSHITLWMQPNKHWGTTLGLAPFSSVKYNIQANRFNETLQTDYSINYTGSGGLNKFFWSNAFAPFKNFSLGVTANFLFGAIDRTEDFAAANNNVAGFSTVSKTNFLGVQLETGLQYGFRLFGDELILGATYTPAARVASFTETLLRTSNGETLQTDEDGESLNYELPVQAGIGLSWQSKRLTLASDFSIQQWSKAQMDTENTLNDTWRWSVGAEWMPNEPSYLFLQQALMLRGGFFIQNYYQKVNGNMFPVWGASIGASIPVRRKLHHLNIGYTYRQQGTQHDNLLLESIHKLSFGITFRDIWFQKQKFY